MSGISNKFAENLSKFLFSSIVDKHRTLQRQNRLNLRYYLVQKCWIVQSRDPTGANSPVLPGDAPMYW